MRVSSSRPTRRVHRRRLLALAPELAIVRKAKTCPPADVLELIATLESLVASLRATVHEPASLRLVDLPFPPSPLSAREREIVILLSNGYAAINIAARLTLSYTTVRNHIQNTLRKLEVHSQVEAVALSFRSGWI